MSNSEDDSGGLQRKRKLNLLDFIKNDQGNEDEVDKETPSKKYEPMSFQSPKVGLGGPRTQETDDYEDEDTGMDDYEQDIRPSFGIGMNRMMFAPATPMTFQKESSSTTLETPKLEEPPKEDRKPKLSYSELESLDEQPTSATKNTFKGKKYGIGAALLKKMGYVEGQGLGKHGQGIIEPIQHEVRKVGVGVGGGDVAKKSGKKKQKGKADIDFSDEGDSSDEEYYKDVPKKSLYQIIVELEDKGAVVPEQIKRISDEHAHESHKPFISLRKEGNKNLEELTNRLDRLNNELEDSMASLKLAEVEERELVQRDKEIELMLETYEQLSEKLNILFETTNNPDLDLSQKSGLLKAEISTLGAIDVSYLADFDLQKTIIIAIKPIITELFTQWDPLDFSDNFVLEELISWKESLPEDPNEQYGELSYFQSLLYSLWYPKIVEALSNWTVDQPNVAITILLDWNEVINKPVIDYLTNNVVKPKIISAIQDWNPLLKSENAPILWLFEYIPYLDGSLDEIKQELVAKYSSLLESWLPSDTIDGLSSFREIIGTDAFNSLINRKLIPKLVKFLVDTFIIIENPNLEILKALSDWEKIIPAGTFEVLFKFAFFNSWKRALYHSLRDEDGDFGAISSGFEKWVTSLQNFTSFSSLTRTEVYDALDLINEYLDKNKLAPIHTNGLTVSKIVEMATRDGTKVKTVDENVQGIPAHRLQVSFKEVVETYCAANNLFITPTKNDLSSGHSLFKISNNINGKNGLVAYIEEDVLWIRNPSGKYEPISLATLQNRV